MSGGIDQREINAGIYRGALQPGKIISFHTYNLQKPAGHQKYDTLKAFESVVKSSGVDPVSIGKILKDYYYSGRSWHEVKKYLDCIFPLLDPDVLADAGEEFK